MVGVVRWWNHCGQKKMITLCSSRSIPDFFPPHLRRSSATWKHKRCFPAMPVRINVFFSTTLETLLRYLETQTLILTGIAGNFCVLFTANDAYMRDFDLFVPSDCTVSNTKKENGSALALMRKFLKADTRVSSRIVLHVTHKKSRKRRRR